MTIKYWLFVFFAGQMQTVGPFDGLPACEKAASQVIVVSTEVRSPVGLPVQQAVTACLSQKHATFKYKEPKP